MRRCSTRLALLLVTGTFMLAAGCFGGGGGGWSDPLESEADCGIAGGGTVEGKVVAPNGTTPAIGAAVRIGTCEAQTGHDGAFRLTSVAAGTATIEIALGMFQQSASVAVTAGGTANADATLDATGILAGVVSGSFDNVEAFLDELGIPYQFVPEEDLVSGDLSAFDAVFVNCGADDSVLMDTAGNLVPPASLTGFVAAGGRVYTSDWADSFVMAGWPGRIVFQAPDSRTGIEGTYTGVLTDPVLQATVQSSNLPVEFDLGGWSVIDSVDTGTQVLVRGNLRAYDYDTGDEGTLTDRPWAARFTESSGVVTYTSFHNHAQLDERTHALLQQLVLGI